MAPVLRKLPSQVVDFYGCGRYEVLANRLGDCIGAAVHFQSSEDTFPVKLDGIDADIEDDANFCVGLAFCGPG